MKQRRQNGVGLERLTLGYLILMASAFLLFPGTGGYRTIVDAKFLLFSLLSGGYVAISLLLMIEGALMGLHRLPTPAVYWRSCTWAERFCLIYLLITWISALASPRFPETILGVSRYEGALSITLYGLSFLLVVRWGRIHAVLLIVFAAAMSLCSLLSLLQLTGANPLGLYPSGYTYFDGGVKYGGAYLGTIGNVDLLASVLALAIPVFWVALLRLPDKGRLWLFLPLILSLAVLIRMNVLAGYVGVLGSALLALPVILPVPDAFRKWLWLAAGLLVFLGLAAIYFVDFGSSLLQELHQLLHGKWDDSFGSGRLYIWRSVLTRVPQHLLLGTGPDTMLYAGIDAFTRYDETLGGTIVSYIDTAHNVYLNILYHQGLFALAAYLLMLGAAAWQWVKTAGRNPAAAILGAGVLGYCIQACFGIDMCINAPFCWLALALLVGRSNRNFRGEEQKGRKPICGKNG